MPIAKSYKKVQIFSVLVLHRTFNIEKKWVSTILKAINCKTISSERLVP